MHEKLKKLGVSDEALDRMGAGAILSIGCPDCGNDIYYTLQGQYYKMWKSGEHPPMLLFCQTCKDYKSLIKTVEANNGYGELLHEKEGDVPETDIIPLVEKIPPLPL